MMKLILLMLMTLLSIIMLLLNNPLTMGLMILTQTTLICLFSGMMIKTYWFSYILFLIFLGGLLVLFIYISSIASNELFSPSMKLKMLFSMMMMMITVISIIKWNNSLTMNYFFNSDMINFNDFKNMLINNNFNKINLNKLYNNQTFLMMMMLIIYLFITLIAVVKITNIFYGPLRSNF